MAASKRKKQKTGAWRYVALVAAVALAAYLILTHYVFVVRSISVVMDDDTRVSRQDVALMSGIKLGSRIDRIDRDAVSQKLTDTGWLTLNDIRTSYPNAVTLYVSARKPAALISHVGTLLVTDADGVVIEQVSSKPDYSNVVYVTEMDVTFQRAGRQLQSGTSGQLEALISLLHAMRTVGCQNLVDSVSVKDPKRMILYTVNGVEVELGDSGKMEDKLRWMQAVVNDLIQRQESFGTLNVTSGTHADYAPRQ